jgi:2'-5' RNA ligase
MGEDREQERVSTSHCRLGPLLNRQQPGANISAENSRRDLHNSHMRLFVAIPLAAAVIGELSAISALLKSREDGLRWQSPESWHITLQFLGNSSQDQCECVAVRLHKLHLPPVSIRLGDLGFFDHAGVFLATVKLSPELLLLQERVTAATEPCGFVAESRPFQPHITLARSKDKGPRQGIGKLKAELEARASRPPKFTGFLAEEFLLYESFLGSGGSRYEVRERFALDGQ